MKPKVPHLGVNVDHIATLRNARGTSYPNPVLGALTAAKAGAYGITVHLREDRRHIRDEDVVQLRRLKLQKLNLEMALTEEMVAIACQIKPDYVCLVPEKREERTTEGGLSPDFLNARLSWIKRLREHQIRISLFLEPNPESLEACCRHFKPEAIELHTGGYAQDWEPPSATSPILSSTSPLLASIAECCQWLHAMGIECHAGHGLHLRNIEPLLNLRQIEEFNIGHAIISESIFDGLENTVRAYVALFSGFPLISRPLP
jgi:pyridoxine 5-phosphate synthase